MAPLDSNAATAGRTQAAPARPARRKRHPVLISLGILVVAIGLLIAFWDWDWFIPLVEARASAASGRKVTLQHLHVQLGRRITVAMDGLAVGNPDGFPADSHFATADRVAVTLDAMEYLRHRDIVIPVVAVTRPVVDAEQLADGRATWDFKTTGGSSGPSPKIGNLQITDGHAHVVVPKLKADFQLGIATQDSPPEAAGRPQAQAPVGGDGTTIPVPGGQIVVTADGTYAQQPITGKLVGGAVLSLRDKATPYPIDLQLANGPTHLALKGTVEDPLAFAGAHIRADIAGPNMELLLPLVGIAFPKTPSYEVSGDLDYADRRIRLRGVQGRIGSSDLNGDVSVDPGPDRPVVEANLNSRKVDLADFGGFVGSEPGRTNTPNQSAEQKAAVAKAEASSQFLPTRTISLPKLKATDVHLNYHAASVLGRSVPFDSVAVKLDIVDGAIHVAPMTLGVGKGQITADISLTPMNDTKFHTKAEVKAQRVDISRLLSATHAVNGGGVIGGEAQLESDGNSAASIIGQGDGELKLFTSGGNVSALLVDLAGLQLGDAVLSALGIPSRANLECFVADFGMRNGVLNSRTLIVDTSESVVTGSGTVDVAKEAMDITLRTEAKHFSVGTLPTPITIGGRFKSPSIRPAVGPLAIRGGAAVGLGILFPPAALLPTIQFGVGNDTGCSRIASKDGAKAAASSANAGEAPDANKANAKSKAK